MRYVIEPRFPPKFEYIEGLGNLRLVRLGEVVFKKYYELGKARLEAERMLLQDNALSATVYEVFRKKGKEFRCRWEWKGGVTVLIRGV